MAVGGGVNGGWLLTSIAADLDGDGNIDLVLVAGDGTFGTGYRIASQGFMPPAPNLRLAAAADLNHEGRSDLVQLTENNGAPIVSTVNVFLNAGQGAFSPITAFSLPSNEYAVGVTAYRTSL